LNAHAAHAPASSILGRAQRWVPLVAAFHRIIGTLVNDVARR
jgi:hypothetical protein